MKKVLTVGILIATATYLPAQVPAMPVAPSEQALAGGRSPSVTFLMQDLGLPESEARERIELQQEVADLSGRLIAEETQRSVASGCVLAVSALEVSSCGFSHQVLPANKLAPD